MSSCPPPAPPLRSFRFDNTALPRRQQFAAWRDVLGGTHDADLPEGQQSGDGFRAAATAWNWGEVLMIDARTEAQRLQRSPGRIRADQIDHYAVRLHRGGTWQGEAGEHVVEAGAGDVMFLDLARPTRSRATLTDNFTMILPRDMLDAVLPPADLHGHVVRGGLGLLLGDWLGSLARNLSGLRADELPRLIAVTNNLLAACLAPAPHRITRAGRFIETALVGQVRRVIARELTALDLSPQMICRALGVSRSRLYRACEPHGGVAAMIKQQRLDRIRAILGTGRDTRLISDIAHQHGFVSEAHFSREFRRAFGCTPREVRAGTAGQGIDLPPAPRAKAAGVYDAVVRQLGG
jgi:AraC-like DNA-binding protein